MSKTKTEGVKANYKIGVTMRGYVVVEAESKAEANSIADDLGCDLDTLWDGFVPGDDDSCVMGSAVPTDERATI
jgi:hypothetical protein